MLVRVTIHSTVTDASVTDTVDCQKEGDVESAVASTLSLFRVQYPDNLPFEWSINVEKA
jgi:hypothetical protein